MAHPPQDPTAGRTARAIRDDRADPPPVLDPTDPRNGQSRSVREGDPVNTDPTDARCGEAT